jgi:hypothetical protein
MMTAQIVMRARQIERALHDSGPWTIKCGGREAPARRVIGEDHVTFYGVVDVAHPALELYSGNELVAFKLMEPSGLAQVSWEFLVIDPEQVAA